MTKEMFKHLDDVEKNPSFLGLAPKDAKTPGLISELQKKGVEAGFDKFPKDSQFFVDKANELKTLAEGMKDSTSNLYKLSKRNSFAYDSLPLPETFEGKPIDYYRDLARFFTGD